MKRLMRAIGKLAWIRLGIRRRIVTMLYPACGSPSFQFCVPYHGMSYRGDIANAQEWHLYFFGGYELKESALMEHLLCAMQDPVVLDIGANLGGHTFMLARITTKVHAFEPYAPLADKIEDQLRRNLIGNVEVHRFGLGEKDDTLSYFLDLSSNNTGTGSFIQEHANADEVEQLPIRRGDDWANGIPVDLIKVDVEGYEASVLNGFRNTLATSKPVILMEVTETSWSRITESGGLDAVLPFDFSVYEICNPTYVLGLFQKERYRLEKTSKIVPRRSSFNILIVPSDRNATVGQKIGVPGSASG